MRLLRLTRQFHASERHYAPVGTPAWRAVRRVLAELEADAEIPSAGDVVVTIPPVLRCLARPIPSAGLLVCYRVTVGAVGGPAATARGR